MFPSNDQFANKKSVQNDNDVLKQEDYQLSEIISPIFGRNHQNKNVFLNNKTSKENHNNNLAAADNKMILINNSINQIQKNQKQQQIYDFLPSRYFEFREKIIANNNLNDDNTKITTVDLMVDNIFHDQDNGQAKEE